MGAQPVLAGGAAVLGGLCQRGQVTVELLLTAGTHVAVLCVAVDEREGGNPSRGQPANPKPSCEAALWDSRGFIVAFETQKLLKDVLHS